MDRDSQDIGAFVERLVSEKGLTNLDAETLEEVKRDLRDRVEERSNAIILERMPPDRLGEFERLIDAGDAARIQSFASEAIPNLAEVLAAELLQFRDRYLNR